MAEAVDHAQVGEHPVGGDEVFQQLRIGRAGRLWLREGWLGGQAEAHGQQSEDTHFRPACSLPGF
jgi:hypothetical protein